MAVLWCGGEDIDFTGVDSVHFGLTTTGGYFRSGYARCCIATANPTTTGYLKGNVFSGGAITSAWLSIRFLYIGSASTSRLLFGLADSGTDHNGIYVGTSSTSSTKFAIWTLDGASPSELDSETGTSMEALVLHKIDLHLQSYGGSSTIDLYQDGVQLINFTGDCSISGTSGLDRVIARVVSSRVAVGYSEWIVSSDDTRSLSLLVSYPNAAGSTNEWDGAYTDIDEYSLSLADSLYTDTDAETAEVNLVNTPTGNFDVKAVKVAAHCCQSTGSSVDSIKLGYYTNSTLSVDAGRAVTTAPYYTTYERLDTTNPVTTDPWTEAEIDALQLAFVSLAS